MSGKKIISFSLWGDEDKYCLGALLNAELQKVVYTDWICRFYLDTETVPHHIIKKLDDLGCEIYYRKNQYYGKYASGKFWRHEVMNDSTVERFIVRDADSRLSFRELCCVEQWIESGKVLRIIRDHPHHRQRIMGGMWGGIPKKMQTFNYDKELRKFLEQNNYYWKKKRQMDQLFLSTILYPMFKDKVFVHDNNQTFKDEKKKRVPVGFKQDYYIGEIIDVICKNKKLCI
jgi:protein O-GlcNAc transferase